MIPYQSCIIKAARASKFFIIFPSTAHLNLLPIIKEKQEGPTFLCPSPINEKKKHEIFWVGATTL